MLLQIHPPGAVTDHGLHSVAELRVSKEESLGTGESTLRISVLISSSTSTKLRALHETGISFQRLGFLLYGLWRLKTGIRCLKFCFSCDVVISGTTRSTCSYTWITISFKILMTQPNP